MKIEQIITKKLNNLIDKVEQKEERFKEKENQTFNEKVFEIRQDREGNIKLLERTY